MKGCKETLRHNALLLGTFAGIAIGVISGIALKSFQPSNEVLLLINYPGELFIRALQLLILPAVAFSLISGSASLNIKENGIIAIRTFVYFLATSLFNACMGIVIVVAINPGSMAMLGLNAQNGYSRNDSPAISDEVLPPQPSLLENLLDLGRNIVPENIVTAAFQQSRTIYEVKKSETGSEIVKKLIIVDGTNYIGLVTLCLVLGSILSTLGDRVKVLLELFKAGELLASECMKIIVWTTPIGIASIICGKMSEVDDLTQTMAKLGWLIMTVSIGIVLDQFIIMQFLYFAFLRKNPFKFYLNVLPAGIMAFITRSSAATLPVSLRCMDEKVKADPRISHFVLPLGVTINRNGTSSFIAVASIFLAQLSGITLTLSNYISIALTATAMSVAAAGPSGSLFVLQSLGIPASEIALLFTIDWLLDRLRTMNNVLGDCYSAAIIEHLSKPKPPKIEIDSVE